MTKRILTLALAALLVFTLAPAVATHANDVIRVTVDGQQVNFDGQAPTQVDGRTLVPVRGVFEMLGFYVGWNRYTQQATLTRDTDVIIITVGSNVFTTNGESRTLDVPAQIIGGSTLVPIRLPLESVGYYVAWNEGTRTVIVSSTSIEEQPAPTTAPQRNAEINTEDFATPIAGNMWLPRTPQGFAQNVQDEPWVQVNSQGNRVEIASRGQGMGWLHHPIDILSAFYLEGLGMEGQTVVSSNDFSTTAARRSVVLSMTTATGRNIYYANDITPQIAFGRATNIAEQAGFPNVTTVLTLPGGAGNIYRVERVRVPGVDINNPWESFVVGSSNYREYHSQLEFMRNATLESIIAWELAEFGNRIDENGVFVNFRGEPLTQAQVNGIMNRANAELAAIPDAIARQEANIERARAERGRRHVLQSPTQAMLNGVVVEEVIGYFVDVSQSMMIANLPHGVYRIVMVRSGDLRENRNFNEAVGFDEQGNPFLLNMTMQYGDYGIFPNGNPAIRDLVISRIRLAWYSR